MAKKKGKRKSKNQKLAQVDQQVERTSGADDVAAPAGGGAISEKAPRAGLVEMAEALESELNSAGVVEGRMLTRLLNACEIAGSLCLAVSERLETKWMVSSLLASVLLYTGGDPSVALLVVGGLMNAVLGKLAKALLAQPRPAGATKTDNGMPSSHALLLFFFGGYLAVFCLKKAYSEITVAEPLGLVTAADRSRYALEAAMRGARWFVAAALSIFSALVLSWSRVDAGLHTAAQVAVGGLLGGGASLPPVAGCLSL